MELDVGNLVESLLRWIHVVAGVLWIGLLYFFNWVNTALQPVLDADTKKKVNPELLPRTLFWFRWGAAFTWVSGLLLLIYMYWQSGLALGGAKEDWPITWGFGAGITVVSLILATVIYDMLSKTLIKKTQTAFFAGWILASAAPIAMHHWLSFPFRSYSIHLGAMFGTFMAFNVWMRIWPAQKKVIGAIKAGETPPADQAAMAGLRSKHNTYMSVPLIFIMVSQHATFADPAKLQGFTVHDAFLPLVILIGWTVTYALYQKAKKVPGF